MDLKAPPIAESAAHSASLVARIAAGDAGAEAEFAAGYRAGIHALVRRHCRPLESAIEDLTQDVLLAVLEKLRAGALRDQAALPAYVRSAVQMTVQAEYRKRGRRGEHVSDALLEQRAVESHESGRDEGPGAELQRQQLARRVQSLLDELPVPRDREILTRFYLLEQDRQRICTDLGLDEAHFRRVLFRARERLAERALRDGLGEPR